MSETKTTNFEALQNWKDGISEKNIDKIKAAIESGVSVTTTVNGKHPLFILLENKDGRHQNRANGYTPGTEKIIDLMVENGLDLLGPVEGMRGNLINNIVFWVDSIMASKLTFEAIKQSLNKGESFKFDTDRIFEMNAPVEGDAIINWENKEKYCNMMSILKEVHEYTAMALKFPLNKDDDLKAKASEEQLKYWMDSFEVPSEEFIEESYPVTYDEYDDAMQAADRENAKQSMLLHQEVAKEANASAEDEEALANIVMLEKEDPQDILKELDQYVGLEDFKKSMKSMIFRVQFDKACAKKGMPVDTQNYHTAFLGNPGTGKTTCSRIKARLLYALDMTGPRYAELSRDKIVGNYLGQTENKLKEILENVDTVFIDEAYALADGSNDDGKDYGRVALNTIVAKLGNEKDAITLFVAGYPKPMKGFIETNEGLQSRIKSFESMPDYTIAELDEILERNLDKRGYKMDADAKEALCAALEKQKTTNAKHFGNAREIVNIVQDIPNHMARRLSEESNGNLDKFNAAALSRITLSDVQDALKNRKMPDAAAMPQKPTIGFEIPDVKPRKAASH